MARHTNGYSRRMWPVYLLVTLVVTGAIVMIALSSIGRAQSYEQLPAPSLPSLTVSTQASSASSPSHGPGRKEPMPTASSTVPAQAPKVEVTASRATQIYVPSGDKKFEISTSVLPLDNCRQGIVPPESGDGFGAVYGCTDYANPGSGSSLVVMAGHSSNYTNTAFNALYKQGSTLVGRDVMIRTVASGNKWLVYRIDQVITPLKTELPYLAEVWGVPGSDTTDRIALITCRQDEPGVKSTRNTVVLARLVGVK